MSKYRIKSLTTIGEIDLAKRAIFKTYSHELGPRVRGGAPAQRLASSFDSLETTTFLSVHLDDTMVGAARILGSNEEVALATGTCHGLELELKFDLGSVFTPGMVALEITNLCVVDEHQRTEAKSWLYKGIYAEAQRRGAHVLLGGGNCRTDARQDAALMHRFAHHIGKASRDHEVVPWTASPAPEVPQRPFYTPQQRLKALEGDWRGIHWPHTLRSFTHDMGAVVLGVPGYDQDYGVFSMPMMATIEGVPSETLARFSAMETA